MSDTLPQDDRLTPAGREHIDPGHVGSAMELLAMVLAATAGFLAPTDWNLTFGFAVIAVALFATGFFALAGREET